MRISDWSSDVCSSDLARNWTDQNNQQISEQMIKMADKAPFIVGMGGTGKSNSSSEVILRQVLDKCAALGAETIMFDGASLNMYMYRPDIEESSAQATALSDALRRTYGYVLCRPGYT